MYIFRAGHLALDNQLVRSSPGRTTSPVPSFTGLAVVLCVGRRLHELFPVQFGVSVGVALGSSCLDDHIGETLWVFSEITRRQSHSKLPDPLDLTDFLPPLLQYFLSWAPHLCILICCDVPWWFHLLQKEVSLMKGKDYTYSWV